MRISLLLFALLAVAGLAAGCGGPDDPDKRLAEACERQIEEIEAAGEEGDTPTAKSTEERLSDVTLVECAGQTVKITEGGTDTTEGEPEGAGAGSETMPAEGEGTEALD
ncbi:MAG: hypothetical protein JWM86_101, partial [Thermoleophilia bacterium]|nr:hypothetical protein [Thermoleophilia bacterium]